MSLTYLILLPSHLLLFLTLLLFKAFLFRDSPLLVLQLLFDVVGQSAIVTLDFVGEHRGSSQEDAVESNSGVDVLRTASGIFYGVSELLFIERQANLEEHFNGEQSKHRARGFPCSASSNG